jgi:hypothetical protein
VVAEEQSGVSSGGRLAFVFVLQVLRIHQTPSRHIFCRVRAHLGLAPLHVRVFIVRSRGYSVRAICLESLIVFHVVFWVSLLVQKVHSVDFDARF